MKAERVVYKYPVSFGLVVSVPGPAKPVLFARQGEMLYAWIEHPREAEEVTLAFVVVGTGHDVPDGMEHVQSLVDGDFVWHLYSKVLA